MEYGLRVSASDAREREEADEGYMMLVEMGM